MHAMDEEFEHLELCGNRVYSMGGSLSAFNPIFFSGAFIMGATSQLLGAGYALGFVQETENKCYYI